MLTPIKEANLKFEQVGLNFIKMLGFVGAELIEYTEDKTVVRVPLNTNTKNHLGSIYFGALAVGADVTCAWIAFDLIDITKKNVSVVFKDLSVKFLKRADGDAHFTCSDSRKVAEAFHQTIEDGERKNIPLEVIATVPSKYEDEPVAVFNMTLSMRYKKP
ncbi:MAG: PaaI family thioesterase [Robiginitomaculum sp.]|nr:PaaI family thioesterase [Robiginitomaculum sp.]